MELQTRAMELQAQTRDAETLWKELQDVKSKNESKSFVQK